MLFSGSYDFRLSLKGEGGFFGRRGIKMVQKKKSVNVKCALVPRDQILSKLGVDQSNPTGSKHDIN